MAYEYDRVEREDGGGAFLMGLLAGTVLGAGLGMLFAPKAGAEVRKQLSEQANALPLDGDRYDSPGVGETEQQASEKTRVRRRTQAIGEDRSRHRDEGQPDRGPRALMPTIAPRTQGTVLRSV